MHVVPYNSTIPQGRLTLVSGQPVADSGVTNTPLYYTPYIGNGISVFHKQSLYNVQFSEMSLSIAGLTYVLPIDIFAHWDPPDLSLTYNAWSTLTLRATELTRFCGFLVSDLISCDLYLGTVYNYYTNMIDSPSLRGVWNMYNRVNRMSQYYSADSHFYTGPARPWNDSANSQVSYVVGLVEDAFPFELTFINSQNNGTFLYGYGSAFGTSEGFFTNAVPYPITAFLYSNLIPTLGFQKLFAFEWGEATTYWAELVINVLYHG